MSAQDFAAIPFEELAFPGVGSVVRWALSHTGEVDDVLDAGRTLALSIASYLNSPATVDAAHDAASALAQVTKGIMRDNPWLATQGLLANAALSEVSIAEIEAGCIAFDGMFASAGESTAAPGFGVGAGRLKQLLAIAKWLWENYPKIVELLGPLLILL
jgi:hypothetical protein